MIPQIDQEEFLKQNVKKLIKYGNLPKSVDMQVLSKVLNERLQQLCGGSVQSYFVLHVNNRIHSYFVVSSEQAVKLLLGNPSLKYSDKVKLIGVAVKKFTNQVKAKEEVLPQIDLVEPSDARYKDIVYCWNDLQMLADWQRTTDVTLDSEAVTAFHEQIEPKIGLNRSSLPNVEESNRQRLHRMCGISSLVILEKQPYSNNKFLTYEYDLCLQKLATTNLPVTKQLYVTVPEDQLSQVLDVEGLEVFLRQRVQESAPDEDHVNRVQTVVEVLNTVCRNSTDYFRYSAHVFGSSGTDYAQCNSDIDVALLSDQGTNGTEHPVKMLRDLMEMLPDGFSEVEIHHGKKPIIASKYKGVEVDICFDNYIQVAVTKNMQAYAQIDHRLRDLVVLVKQWIKVQEVHNKSHGYLPPYSTYCLCIYYMQQIGLLPYLQELVHHEQVTPDDIAGGMINGNDCRYLNNLDLLKQIWKPFVNADQLTVSMLFCGFFQFYSNFDFRNKIISIRTCQILTPKQPAKQNTDGFSNNIFIEDPFELIDLGVIAQTDRMHQLQALIRQCYELLLANRFENIYQKYHAFEYTVFTSHLTSDEVKDRSDFIRGQLVIDEFNSEMNVVNNEQAIEIPTLKHKNRAIHGDLVAVKNGKIEHQFDEKEQIMICSAQKGPFSNELLLVPVDNRFPEAITLNLKNIFEIPSVTKCNPIVAIKRLYFWRHTATHMHGLCEKFLGFPMDIHSQMRSIFISNYTNNYCPTERCFKEPSSRKIHRLNFGPILNTVLFYSMTQTETTVLILYLPDSIDTSHNYRIALELHLDQSAEIISMDAYSTKLDPSVTEESNNSALEELLQQISDRTYPSFVMDSFGYPIDRNNRESVVLNGVMSILEKAKVTSPSYEHLLIRLFKKTMHQFISVFDSFYLLAQDKPEFEATVTSIATTGKVSLSLHINELGISVTDNRLNATSVTRISAHSCQITLESGRSLPVSVNDAVSVELKVETSQVPFRIVITKICSNLRAD